MPTSMLWERGSSRGVSSSSCNLIRSWSHIRSKCQLVNSWPGETVKRMHKSRGRKAEAESKGIKITLLFFWWIYQKNLIFFRKIQVVPIKLLDPTTPTIQQLLDPTIHQPPIHYVQSSPKQWDVDSSPRWAEGKRAGGAELDEAVWSRGWWNSIGEWVLDGCSWEGIPW